MAEEKDLREKTEETGEETLSKKSASDSGFGFESEKLEISLERMFRSGVHFGHHKSRKNPRAEKYIFTTKSGINIINLEKTAEKLKEAMDFVEKLVSTGEDILFVGTKKQAKRIVQEAAEKCQMPYVSERWLGGTFTNFPVISERTKYLRDGRDKQEKGEYSKYTKFEQMKISEELDRLEKKMGGIKNMTRVPGAIFCASVIEDNLAIKEARAKKIPVIALCDTNVSPEGIDYPIPANEDAVSSIRLLLGYMAKAVLDGRAKIKKIPEKKEAGEKSL